MVSIHANMAAPWINGTGNTDTYISKDIDILKEYLKITLIDFDRAEFDVQYIISTDKQLLKIPFIFDTNISTERYGRGMDDHMNFRVLLDNREAEVSEVASMYNDSINERWMREFRHNFDGDLQNLYSFKYFELDLEEGEHIIQVKYIANATIDLWKQVREYVFVYNLRPARYWKSFGGLDVTIDASAIKEGDTSVNIGGKEIVNNVYNRYFNELPQDEITIISVPRISVIASWVVEYAFILVFILIAVMGMIHFVWIYRYRKKYPHKRFSIAAIIGALLLSFIFCFLLVYTPYLIDDVIGEHASRRHGYIFLWFALYPIFLIVYLIPVLIVDYILKQKFKK